MAVLEDACVPSLDSIIHARKYLDFMLRDHDFFINKQKIFSKPSLKEQRNKPTRAKGERTSDGRRQYGQNSFAQT